MDPFKFHRMGPGLTFVTADAIGLRLVAIGFGDTATAMAFVASLGLGSIRGPDGIVFYHWESFVVKMLDAMSQNRSIAIKRATKDKPTSVTFDKTRVTLGADRWFSETRPNTTEMAVLCMCLDKAFDGEMEPAEMVERVKETRRLFEEMDNVVAGAKFGLETLG